MNQGEALSEAVSEAVRQVFRAVLHPIVWLTSRPNRARLRGARVEVILFIVTRSPNPSVLLARSPYYDIWMPPQEGVHLSETFDDAVHRCLRVECGIDVADSELRSNETCRLRSIKYLGGLPLQRQRHGERPVADDAIGTWMEAIELKAKAYWMATLWVPDASHLSFSADGTELLELRWASIDEARARIVNSNHPGKRELLVRALDTCERLLKGAGAPLNAKQAADL